MTTHEWVAQARRDAGALKALLAEYHPVNRQPGTRREIASESGALLQRGDWITAPGAEAACVQVRRQIRDAFDGNPQAKLDAALADGNVAAIMSLLNDAWFGVPESQTCWRIRGFKEAVRLLEEPPDDGTDDE